MSSGAAYFNTIVPRRYLVSLVSCGMGVNWIIAPKPGGSESSLGFTASRVSGTGLFNGGIWIDVPHFGHVGSWLSLIFVLFENLMRMILPLPAVR